MPSMPGAFRPPHRPSRIEARRGYDAKRAAAPGRKLYATERWQRLRLAVFERDGYVCRRTGVLCAGVEPAPDSPVAHHIDAHRGDPQKFFDIDNIETVTKAWHDRWGQRADR